MKNTLPAVITIICICIAEIASAQQVYLSGYFFDPAYLNPALCGYSGAFRISARYREQWTGVDGSPQTALLSAEGPLGKGRSSAGLQLYNDKLGISTVNSASLQYAYHLPLRNGNIAAGMQFQYGSFREDFVSAHALQPDPALTENLQSGYAGISAGIAYTTSHGYAGIALPDFYRPLVPQSYSDQEAEAPRKLPLIVCGAWSVPAGSDWKVIPSFAWYAGGGIPDMLAVNVNIAYRENLLFAIGYRSLTAYTLGAEYRFSGKLRIAYLYDIDRTEIGIGTYGTHEFMLGFDLGKKAEML